MNDFSIPEIEALSGKGAVFVRGFMQAFYGGDTSLRRCQEAGKREVEECNDSISVPYISKLSKLLVAHRVVGRKKIGRHYEVTSSTNSDSFQAWLESEDHVWWGASVDSAEKDQVEKVRLLNFLSEHHAIRSTSTHRIPKAAYRVMIEKVNKGEYDLAFIPANAKAGVKVEGQTYRILPMKADDE